jgi:hypothetical protein
MESIKAYGRLHVRKFIIYIDSQCCSNFEDGHKYNNMIIYNTTGMYCLNVNFDYGVEVLVDRAEESNFNVDDHDECVDLLIS